MSHHSIIKIALTDLRDLAFSAQEWMRSVNRAFATHGTYTPTITNTTNLAASTAYECTYQQIQNIVHVFGKVDIDPTGAGQCVLGISLPHDAEFTAAEQLAGTASCPTIAGQSAALYADITNQRATMEWVAVDVTNQPMYFTFTYRID